ncbi:MAG: hypothetical protein LAO23_19560 [Acidobacteriia bacterium]|nr:hypothetical protein [Terriglobia bacterium]
MAELQIPVTKGGGTITVNTADIEQGGDLTADVFREALIQGLKVILNRGMSKITKEAYTNKDGVTDEVKMKADAMAKANQTFADMRENKIRFMGEKVKTKVAGEVMTEARRIAKGYVKEGLKAAGEKIAHYDAKEITKAANLMIAENPEIVEEAQKNVDARKAEAAGGGKIELKKFASTLKANPKLVEKAEKEKKERKAASSATKAGKVAVRAKPKAGASATAH